MEKTLWESIDAAGAAGAEFRLGDLRRRRLHARAHALDGQTHSDRDAADAGRASHLRRCHARGDRRGSCAPITRPACATSWRCAAIRSAARRAQYAPHPGGYANAADLVAGIKRIAPISKFRSRPIRKSIPTARRSKPISTCSRPRSMPARAAPSPSSSSKTTSISAISIACARAASISRSCRASCRCRTSRRRLAFAERCGASVPAWLAERFEGLDDDAATRKLIAAAVAAEQVFDLVDRGVTDFPFLHDESRRPRLRDLPPARPAAGQCKSTRERLECPSAPHKPDVPL